ncbi:MAG: hypothetical protein IPL49_16820 [Saprospirales bacterium]|nr:hypothetical protein [Saprospirales bacterium]
MPRYLFFLLPFFWTLPAPAQPVGTTQLGLVLVLGHPITRIGVQGQLALTGDFWETTAGLAVHYNFRQYGPPKKGWEVQPRLGVGVGFGPAGDFSAARYGGSTVAVAVVATTYALAYTWTAYLDQIQTSQFTGTFTFRGGPVFIGIENDAFALFRPADQFRTGAIRMGYFHEKWLLEGLVALWHGQTKAPGISRQQLPGFPGRWGFRDLSEGLYGRYSNGVAMLRVQYLLPYGQVATAGLGIDAEQVRDFFQNRLVHDLRFVPRKLNRAHNPHYPMLDTNGCPYLYEEGQEVRKARLVWQVGVNGGGVY